MQIIPGEKPGTLTFVPMSVREEETLVAIANILKPGQRLRYDGKEWDGPGRKFVKVHLYAGGRRRPKRVHSSPSDSAIENVFVGGVPLLLCGTTKSDKRAVNGIRNCCYFGRFSGLIFLKLFEVGDTKAISVTSGYCKLCRAPMVDMVSCEWKICSDCSTKCKHKYETGPMHGGGVQLAMGQFCGRCGRRKPK